MLLKTRYFCVVGSWYGYNFSIKNKRFKKLSFSSSIKSKKNSLNIEITFLLTLYYKARLRWEKRECTNSVVLCCEIVHFFRCGRKCQASIPSLNPSWSNILFFLWGHWKPDDCHSIVDGKLSEHCIPVKMTKLCG